jgi:hypothetical protein
MRFHATSEGNIPFTPEEELEADLREAEWLAGEADRLIKAKIAEGEAYIESVINDAVSSFNAKYFTKFLNINDMVSYSLDANYSLNAQCDTLIKWKNSFWDTARLNQASVLAGTTTDAEFLAALPVAPVV